MQSTQIVCPSSTLHLPVGEARSLCKTSSSAGLMLQEAECSGDSCLSTFRCIAPPVWCSESSCNSSRKEHSTFLSDSVVHSPPPFHLLARPLRRRWRRFRLQLTSVRARHFWVVRFEYTVVDSCELSLALRWQDLYTETCFIDESMKRDSRPAHNRPLALSWQGSTVRLNRFPERMPCVR